MDTPTLMVEVPVKREAGVTWMRAPRPRTCAKMLACIPCQRVERVLHRYTNRDFRHGRKRDLSVDTTFGHAKEMLEARDATSGGGKYMSRPRTIVRIPTEA
jgi:hypothetical protein